MNDTEERVEIGQIQDALKETIATLIVVEQQCDLILSGQAQVDESIGPRIDNQIDVLRTFTTRLENINNFKGMIHNLTGQIQLLVRLSDKIAIMASRQAKMEKELNQLLLQVQKMKLGEFAFPEE